MKLIKNYLLLLILKLTVLFKLINSNELPKNNTKLLIQRNTDYIYHDRSCGNYYNCGSSTYLFCNQTTSKCQCKSNYKWNSEDLICSKSCFLSYECEVYNKNSKCYNGMCVCKDGYKGNGYSDDDVCKECISDSDCSTPKPSCNIFSKCESCSYGYSYSKSAEMCEYDYNYSYNWAYYLWFLILIPIMIVVSVVYCCWRRRVTPGAVIISNTQLYGQQQQQFPPPPPPYTETNTYRY